MAKFYGIRKNICFFKEQEVILNELVKAHDGNLSSTVRELIDFAGFVIQKTGSLENAKEQLILNSKQSALKPGDKLVLRVESLVISNCKEV